MTSERNGTDQIVARRRAIEALRAGVPSRDAVAALGSGQPAIEDRCWTQQCVPVELCNPY